MTTNVPIQKQRVEARPSPDIQRRINGGWLTLWRTVYPDIPPPTETRSPDCGVLNVKANARGPQSERSGLRRAPCRGRATSLPSSGCLARAGAAGDRLRRPPAPRRAARPSRHASRPVSSSRPWSKARTRPSPRSRTQETVKVRTYTVPAGSRDRAIPAARCRPSRNYQPSTLNLSTCHPQPSTLNPQPPINLNRLL